MKIKKCWKKTRITPTGQEYECIFILDENGITHGFTEDPANTDYQQYLEWVSQGNEPLPPDPIPEPEPLTAQQKLEAAGLTIEELKQLLGL
jgi:hypothetical protein